MYMHRISHLKSCSWWAAKSSPGHICLLALQYLTSFSNQHSSLLIDGRPHRLERLLTAQKHLDEERSGKEKPVHAPFVKLCVLAQGYICSEGSLFFLIHTQTGRGANCKDPVC